MGKFLTGSTLSYGSTLPPATNTADGSMFFLTAAVSDPANSPSNPTSAVINRKPGLYVFSFQQDADPAIGDQVRQTWQMLSSINQEFISSAGGTVSGTLLVTNVDNSPGIHIKNGAPGIRFTEIDQAPGAKDWFLVVDGAHLQLQTYDDSFQGSQTVFSVNRNGVGFLNGSKIWTEGNDGAASGLDADKLDGYDSAYFLDVGNQTGLIPLVRGGTGTNGSVAGGIVYGSPGTGQLLTSGSGVAGHVLLSGGTGSPTWSAASSLVTGAALVLKQGGINNANNNITFNYSGQLGQPTWLWGVVAADGAGNIDTRVYNPANFSVAYAANAGTLGTLSPSVAAVGNTIVQRDSNNHVFFNYINSSTPNGETQPINQVIVTNGSDNYYRKVSVDALKTALGVGSVGSYVAKTGDTMSGNLGINGITLTHSSSLIQTSGSISSAGSIVTTGGNFIAQAGNLIAQGGTVTAGGTSGIGFAQLQASGSGNSGHVEFWGGNGVRAGYIGNSTGSGSQDNGAISFGMATANFFGDVIAYASDARLKTNVTIIPNALDKIATLGGYEYDWDLEKTRRLGFTPAHSHEHGLLAQEVQKVLPDAVAPAPFNSDYLTVKYERLIALLVAGMNEQQAQINALMSEVEDLKNQR